MLYQASIKAFTFVNAIVLFGQFRGDVDEFKSYKLEAALLEACNDVADESSLDAFWFDND